MLRLLKSCFVSLSVLLLWIAPASAQCQQPDGLDGGPCCTQAQLLVPRPKFTHQALGICWRDCNIDNVTTYNATFNALQPGLGSGGTVPCGWFRTNIVLRVGSTVYWNGPLQATYSRTWLEAAPSGAARQVWRFLLNGDLRATVAAGPPPCPVPPCAPAFNSAVRFTGYVDYARDCGTTLFEHAWMLTHACDAIDHAPGFPRAGAFHPNRAYTFVGPAAGFVIAPILPIETGTTVQESLRRWNVPVPGTTGPVLCEIEERVQQAIITPTTQFCMCAGGPVTQFQGSDFNLVGACGSVLSPAAGIPFFSMAIGSWTNPAVYPGNESLRWNTGDYVHFDPCNGVVRPEFYFGVTTLGGDPAFQMLSTGAGPPLLPTFVDQCNSMQFPGGVTLRNVPFLSDEVFGINLP